jgi:hypothetical protein
MWHSSELTLAIAVIHYCFMLNSTIVNKQLTMNIWYWNNVQVWKFVLIIQRAHRLLSVSETGVSINSWRLQRMGCACKTYGKKFTSILVEHVAFIFSIEYVKSTNLTVYFSFPQFKVRCRCKCMYLDMSAVL